MDLNTTKVVVAVLFGIIRFSSGTLPVKIYNFLRKWEEDDGSNTFINRKRHNQVNTALALCQSFGGGVLFATCFLHMMLEVYVSVEELKVYGDLNTNYPLSQLTICTGFLFVYFLEELSHWFISKVPEEPIQIGKKRNNYTKASISPVEYPTPQKVSNAFIIEDEYENEKKTKEETEKNEKQPKEEDQNSLKKVLSIDDNLENIINDNLSLNSEVLEENAKNLKLNAEEEEEKEEAVACVVKSKQQVMRCILMILALSLHAIFEGLSIGLQTKAANVWYLFIAVSIHSATILFCMGFELLLARVKARNIYIQMLILSLVSPVGVIMGLLITLKSNMETRAKSTAIVLLEGLSAGTILYITFFEVLNREKERRTIRLYRSICIVTGFVMMAVLQYLEKYSIT